MGWKPSTNPGIYHKKLATKYLVWISGKAGMCRFYEG